jgi:hypothetical protein
MESHSVLTPTDVRYPSRLVRRMRFAVAAVRRRRYTVIRAAAPLTTADLRELTVLGV